MVKWLKKAIAILPLFLFQHLASQEHLSLDRYIKIALENNFALKIARNNEAIAENNYTIGNAGMLPVVSNTNIFAQNSGIMNNIPEAEDPGTVAFSDVDLNMTLFRGFRVQRTYQKLGVQKEIGGLNTQISIENLVAQIVSEYHNYIQQLILYDNLAYAVSLSRERLRIDEERYLLGSASRLELLQSIVYLNADSSRYARQNEVLRTVQIRLNELMARENIGEELMPEDTIIAINPGLIYEDLLSRTLENNTSIRIASGNQIISELDYKIISSRSYPYLNLSSKYRLAYGNGGVNDGYNYGLTVGIDIFDGFNRRRERSNARIVRENSYILYQDIEKEVRADLLTIFYAYENNLRLLRLEEQNVRIAKENLEIALERYKLGSLSGIELREVQRSLLDAEERMISVRYQTKLAEISLLQISGRIMEYI